MDAKDILGIPKSSFPGSLEKKPRPPRESQRKPDGISRELYALTGGLAPLMPSSIDASHLKPKHQAGNEKITWQWLPFTSSARTDNLQLYHWVRVVNGVLPSGDYSFAKYNKSVDVVKYTDEEYEKYLSDPVWSKEETNNLFDLCERFDLRFVIIADRFPSSRTIEELKTRYYAVSKALLRARSLSPSDVSTHPLYKETYNASQEVERKRALAAVLSQTRQQERRDAEILSEAKRITESRNIIKDVEEPEPSEVVVRSPGKASIPTADCVSPSSSDIGAPTHSSERAAIPQSIRMLRACLRTYVHEQMVQAANSSAGVRTIKRVDQTLEDFAVRVKPKVPTRAVCLENLELRKEILILLDLQKQLQYKEQEASANLDGSYIDSPSTPKDRTFLPDYLGFGGERVNKRDHKRKAPGRFSDAPPSPPLSRRPKKLKASD
ncbi:putative DNA methyltransferase 1-associated protein [Zostera marina]|uniref:Putative DNA methyltransferase 1-associated protein n=1 Tax=Zostera marina TaxID=29655 RepID=A0A0K9PTT1_ZOSMR|nr:putative DNA methyltransferase 1-associated protein [Zostera marina]